MPGAARFRHKLVDAAVLVHEIVRGNLRFRVGQARERLLAGRHAGVVQQQDVDRASRASWFGEGMTFATVGESALNVMDRSIRRD